MIKKDVINIARDFSVYPGGRTEEDSPASGEELRRTFLAPALRDSDLVYVEMDGTLGYASNFLEEAFGGLVAKSGFTESDLKARLHLVTENSIVAYSIWRYIHEAVPLSSADAE